MGEVIRDKYRGRGVGFVQTGAAVGPGLAALVYAGLYAVLPEAIAWRALFAVGILPALLVLWIRGRAAPGREWQHDPGTGEEIDKREIVKGLRILSRPNSARSPPRN